MNKELPDFAARLRHTIQGRDAALRCPDSAARCPYQEVEFNSLALELFALQFKHNAVYHRMCKARGLTPNVIEHWTQIPAVPTAAFKELELTCLAPQQRTAVFHSSGTTEQKPSCHYHNSESLEIYEASLWSWFAQNALPNLRLTIDDLRLICLTPPPAKAPHSSLVHMFEVLRQTLGASESAFVGKLAAGGSWTLDFDAVLSALEFKTQNPKLILGTAFSFVHLLDFLSDKNLSFRLPPRSHVMETGGYKNRSRTMPKSELHALITERLGVPREDIICEYGMSELSSQAYDGVTSGEWRVAGKGCPSHHPSPVTRHFRFPPWAQVQIISPETGQEAADGETGLIRVFDLANVFSMMAIQTEDLGVRLGDGFELIGRAQLSEPRGCSLMSA